MADKIVALFVLIQTVLVAMKLGSFVSWAWGIVMLPTWVPICVLIAIGCICVIFERKEKE